jgi:hypothetical protein
MNQNDNNALAFLISWLGNNPQILHSYFRPDMNDPEDVKEFNDMLVEIGNAQSWDMMGPRKPVEDDEFQDGVIGYYGQGDTPNQYLEPTKVIPTKKVKFIRYFYLKNEMTDLGFRFLELKAGGYLVGHLTDNFYEED